MSTGELKAIAEAAFAIESAASPTLHHALLVAPKEIVRDVWMVAYLSGRRDAFTEAHGMVDAIGTCGAKAVSTAPATWTAAGAS